MDRMRLGVGLPTRLSFYKNLSDIPNVRIFPYFSLDLKKVGELLVKDSKRTLKRSDFRCYFDFSKILAFHLQRIIELPDAKAPELDKKIRHIFKSLEKSMDFVRAQRNCNFCRMFGISS